MQRKHGRTQLSDDWDMAIRYNRDLLLKIEQQKARYRFWREEIAKGAKLEEVYSAEGYLRYSIDPQAQKEDALRLALRFCRDRISISTP